MHEAGVSNFQFNIPQSCLEGTNASSDPAIGDDLAATIDAELERLMAGNESGDLEDNTDVESKKLVDVNVSSDLALPQDLESGEPDDTAAEVSEKLDVAKPSPRPCPAPCPCPCPMKQGGEPGSETTLK